MAALGLFCADQFVAVLIAEMRDVDDGERVGRIDEDHRTARHGHQFLTCPDNGKRAFQPAQIVENGVQAGQFLAQNFQNGFLVASAVSCGAGSGAA